MKELLKIASILTLANTLGCITSEEKNHFRSGMFGMQTRLLAIEDRLAERESNGKTAEDESRGRFTNFEAELGKIQEELRLIQGVMDLLTKSIPNGELLNAPSDAPSIKKSVENLTQRMSSLESTQQEILASLKKQPQPTKKRKPLSSLQDIRRGFKDRRYQHVVDDAPKLLARKKVAKKDSIRYYYARSLFKVGRISDAALEFNDLLKVKGLRSLHPHIRLRLGDCFRHLGNRPAALVYYRELIEKHPSSNEAKKALTQVQKLTTTTTARKN